MRRSVVAAAIFVWCFTATITAIIAPASASGPVTSSFTTAGEQDLTGATDGHYVVTQGNNALQVLTMTGTMVSSITTYGGLFCPTGSPLTVCATGGFDADQRVTYDTGAQRWIVSALWIFGGNSVAQDVMAVSKTNNPSGGWWLYQFPACGASDTQDGSDQPHIGFNNQWIVVTSACNIAWGGKGIAVFNKTALYAGNALALGTNWFEFADTVEATGGMGRDDPARTYVATSNNSEILTNSMTTNTGFAETVYSSIDGSVNAPVYHPNIAQVVTTFPSAYPTDADDPACQTCVVQYGNSWIHSSGVWNVNGTPYALSTMVTKDTTHNRANQVINVALNMTTHTAISKSLKGTDGYGPMTSEIAMPMVPVSGRNLAVVGYLFSSGTMNPSLLASTWDLGNNTFDTPTVVKQGTLSPTGYDLTRWVDFTSALTPIPGTSAVVIGGQVAVPSSVDPNRSIAWATLPVVGTPSINGPTTATVTDAPSGADVVINTTVNTGNRNIKAHTDYGPTSSYGGWSSDVNLAASNTPTAVQLLPMDKLYPGSTLHYRVHLTQTGGPDILGPDLVASNGIANVNATAPSGYNVTATVTANINPYGVSSSAQILYGPTSSYGGWRDPVSIGSGTTPVAYSAQPWDTLSPGSVLHYRVKVIQTNGNTEYSQDKTITGT